MLRYQDPIDIKNLVWGALKPFVAVAAVILNSTPLSVTLSLSTFEDKREFNARSACDLFGPVPC